MEEIETGKHLAKIVDYGFAKTKSGAEQVFITFELLDGRKKKWFGSLKQGKACEFTIDTMLKIGFNGDWDSFSEPGVVTAFNPNKELEIDVQDEHFNGQTYRKIKWINDPNKGAVEGSQAVQIVKSMDLKALTLARKAELGIKSGTGDKVGEFLKKKAVNEDLSDIPF